LNISVSATILLADST